MTTAERNETLRTRLAMAVDKGFVLKPHHFMSRDRETGEMYGYESIIFDPEFARALWGKKRVDLMGQPAKGYYSIAHATGWLPMYKFQLMQMAIADDRIEYLGANS